MKSLIFIFLCLLIIGASISCTKRVEVHCKPSNYSTSFVHFDSTEIKELTYYKYPQNQQFAHPIDSLKIVPSYRVSSSGSFSEAFQSSDTISIYVGYISTGYDWKIQAMPANRTWHISQITYQDEVHLERASSSSAASTFSCPLNDYVVDANKISAYVFFLTR